LPLEFWKLEVWNAPPGPARHAPTPHAQERPKAEPWKVVCVLLAP
jgi:hypothetical protein